MNIILHTENDPENNAMLAALYSRSADSVTEHIEKIRKSGASKFMELYVKKYSHNSIADCGFITLYFENISMLAAKALEDNPLFNGQECSSRYIDFSKQEFYNPFLESSPNHALAKGIFDDLRSFYVTSLSVVKDDLYRRFPKPEGENDVRYEKSISARAFDILRGYLPSSAVTNVAWSTSLRKADEFLIHLMHHPLPEVKQMACIAYLELYEKYPSSFREDYAEAAKVNSADTDNMLRHVEGHEVFKAKVNIFNFYDSTNGFQPKADFQNIVLSTPSLYSELDRSVFMQVDKIPLPRHHPLSRQQVIIKDFLDFGSFRDIQRHRNGYCSNYILTTRNGFHEWYFNNLSTQDNALIKARATKLLHNVIDACIDVEKSGDFIKAQYLVPMGFKVPVQLEYSIEQCRYVAKLRSGKTVHPTLRPLAHKIGAFLNDKLGLSLDYDKDESDWTLKRGDQDIVAK